MQRFCRKLSFFSAFLVLSPHTHTHHCCSGCFLSGPFQPDAEATFCADAEMHRQPRRVDLISVPTVGCNLPPPPPPRPEALKRALNGKRGTSEISQATGALWIIDSQPATRCHVCTGGRGGAEAVSHAKVYGCLFIGQPCCRVCVYMLDYFLLVVVPGGLMASVVSYWMLINIYLAIALVMKEIYDYLVFLDVWVFFYFF